VAQTAHTATSGAARRATTGPTRAHTGQPQPPAPTRDPPSTVENRKRLRHQLPGCKTATEICRPARPDPERDGSGSATLAHESTTAPGTTAAAGSHQPEPAFTPARLQRLQHSQRYGWRRARHIVPEMHPRGAAHLHHNQLQANKEANPGLQTPGTPATKERKPTQGTATPPAPAGRQRPVRRGGGVGVTVPPVGPAAEARADAHPARLN